jgi:hypothetical protein
MLPSSALFTVNYLPFGVKPIEIVRSLVSVRLHHTLDAKTFAGYKLACFANIL